jgi:two-component sensor histidine kinase
MVTMAVTWTIEQRPTGERLVLRWQEKGGPAVSPPTRKGFGSRMIEQSLSQQLSGAVRLEFLAEGLVCTFDIPVPNVRPEELEGAFIDPDQCTKHDGQ